MHPSKPDLINALKMVHSNFNHTLSQFSDIALNTVPFQGSWTAGQVATHIIKSNSGILTQIFQGKSRKTDRAFDKELSVVQAVFRGPDKVKSAPELEPDQPPHQLKDLLDMLKAQKEQQITAIDTVEWVEVCEDLDFPPSPNGLTKYEWIHLMMEHTNRHYKQLENIYDLLQSPGQTVPTS